MLDYIFSFALFINTFLLLLHHFSNDFVAVGLCDSLEFVWSIECKESSSLVQMTIFDFLDLVGTERGDVLQNAIP